VYHIAFMTDTGSQRSLELRFIQIYFWTYWLQNINTTYLNLYLKKASGLTGTQIGILSSVLFAAGIFLTPLIGLRFDHTRNRPRFLSMLAILAGASFCAYALPVPWYALIPVGVAFACGWLPVVPLTDSLANTPEVTAASPRGYGGYRRWGTIGFALAGALSGWLTGNVGLWSFFPLYVFCALVVAWYVRGIPGRVAAGPHQPGSRVPAPRDILDLLKQKNFRRFLGIVLVASVGGSACYTFRSIYLSSIGIPDSVIGYMWALIIPGELVCFTLATKWRERWGAGPLVTAGLVVNGLRWILLSFVNVPLLYAVEILHGVGFALYWPAAVNFVQTEAPPRLRGTAQILFFSTAAGIGNAIGAVVGGRIFDVYGPKPVLWFGGTLFIIGGVMQALFVKHAPPRQPFGEGALGGAPSSDVARR